jgi:glucose/arabinose dehydrogenase
MQKKITILLIWLFTIGALAFAAQAQPITFPTITLVPRFAGLVQPVFITHAGDGSGRIFIVEQRGTIKIVRNGIILPQPFLDISARVNNVGEQGLLSVAFPPGFATKQYFYVYYTRHTGNNLVARYSVSADPDVADPTSEERIIGFLHPTFANHNGGQLAFSPRDGFLYIGTGDGGGAGDPNGNAQNPLSLLGKILRIDVESGPGVSKPYKIPRRNPFRGVAGFRREIWALGVRNPWRFSFDRATGDMYIGDVGQATREEIDFQPAGARGGRNYGWNILEGRLCFSPPTGCVKPAGYRGPITNYNHALGVSVTGGYVYRGITYPALQGFYFFADLTGKVFSLARSTSWQRALLLQSALTITTFGEDEPGNLYLADYASGQIFEVTNP